MIVKILTALFGSLFGAINNWITGKRADTNAKELGASRERAENAARGQAEVDTARRAGDSMRDDLARDPDRVRQPDAHAAERGSDGIS